MKWLWLLPVAWLAGCAALPPGLPAGVHAALAQAGVGADALAAIALPLAGGRAWQFRADTPMQPASTMKLATSIVALARLGPDHRGRTDLLGSAPVVDGVLQGDLVLRGGADPDLNLAQFWQMLETLRESGIHGVAGDLVVDRSLFDPARPEIGVPPFDGSPEFPYNVIPDALQLDGSLLGLEIRSDADGVHARAWPALDGIRVESRMTPTDTPCRHWDDDWKPATVTETATEVRVVLNGGFPRDCLQRPALQLVERQRLVDAVFRTLWRGLGGTWAGHLREGVTPADARVLATHESRPWGELLRPMNKRSDNVLARLLFLQLGAAAGAGDGRRTTAERAAAVEREWLAAHGIDATGLVLDNGSGLSRSERITPRQLARMLVVSQRGPLAPDLLMSLPIAGRDGTVRHRLKDSPAAGWARLKTGTLRNVVAVAGTVRDARGRPWVLVAMINDQNAMRARPALDALVDWVARSGSDRGTPLPP